MGSIASAIARDLQVRTTIHNGVKLQPAWYSQEVKELGPHKYQQISKGAVNEAARPASRGYFFYKFEIQGWRKTPPTTEIQGWGKRGGPPRVIC
eukprot:10092741-Ditylum_brightwellii.AAC.1